MGVPVMDSTTPATSVTVLDEEPALLELLYLRHAWRLRTRTTVPELDPVPDRGESAMPGTLSKEAWTALWDVTWASARGLGGGTARSWADVGGWNGLDREACRTWMLSLPRADGDAFEALVTDELAAAAERSLRVLRVLPYRGHFVEQDDEKSLTVSWKTRASRADYAQALQRFEEEE
jgi:hypothetical protein